MAISGFPTLANAQVGAISEHKGVGVGGAKDAGGPVDLIVGGAICTHLPGFFVRAGPSPDQGSRGTRSEDRRF